MTQTWSASAYARHGRFVADLATEVVALLEFRRGERILDLGCGDGALTEVLHAEGADVLGYDSSPAMVREAQARGLQIMQGSGDRLPFVDEFDAVFSNAALHWMRDQEAVLAGVFRALRPGGRFVAEMGGHGNIAAIRTALSAAVTPYRVDAEHAGGNVFFTAAEYQSLLERQGFAVETIALVSRPTLLPTGIRAWITTFRLGLLEGLEADAQTAILNEVEERLRPILCDRSGQWWADYVRLRFRARRPK